MIPSDHFVRFYNEIFKYLEDKGHEHLEDYFLEISRHQETHCLKQFSEGGLQGMYDYWMMIKKEENCDSDKFIEDGQYGKVLKSFMNGCPSLAKVQDNDAGSCPLYCYHCPGWVLPLMSKVGYYYVYDLISLDMPRCQTTICEHIEDARAQLKLVLKRHKGDRTLVKWNFPEQD